MISVTVDNVQELMVAADMLQLQEVVSVCGEFLKGHMDPSNCVGIFQFLEQIACMEMLEFTENYIHVHFLEVQNTVTLYQFLSVTSEQCFYHFKNLWFMLGFIDAKICLIIGVYHR